MKKILTFVFVFLLTLSGCGGTPNMPATPEPPEMRLTTPPPTPELTETPEPTIEPTSVPPPEFAPVTPTPTPWLKPIGAFSIEDMRVDEITLHADLETVIGAFGEPLLRESYTESATGSSFVTLAYDEGEGLFFHMLKGETLTRATLTTNKHAGPRGLKVGDSYERVLSVFARDPDMLKAALALPDHADWSEPFVLYGEENPYHEGETMPPMAVVDPRELDNERGEFLVRLLDPSQPYTEEEKETGSSQFLLHGALIYYIDKENLTVTRINWRYGSFVE